MLFRRYEHHAVRWDCGLRLSWHADLQRIDPDRPFDVLQLGRAEVGDRHVKPAAHLAVGILGKADRAGLGDPFQTRGDVDAVAHQIAVRLLDDIAQVDADPELDAALRRQALALRSTVPFLHLGIAQRTMRRPLLRQTPQWLHRRCAFLTDAAVVPTAIMGSIRSLRSARSRAKRDPRPRPPEVTAIANYVGDKNRRNFPGLHHSGPSKITGADVSQAPAGPSPCQAVTGLATSGARMGCPPTSRKAYAGRASGCVGRFGVTPSRQLRQSSREKLS